LRKSSKAICGIALHLRLSFRGAPRGASPEPITTGLSDSHRF